MEVLTIILAVIILILGAAFVFMVTRHTAGPERLSQALQGMQQQSVQTILQQLNAQQQSQENQANQLHNRVAETSKAVYTLQSKLAQLEEGNKRILDMSKGITELQDILQAPKLRGNQGEVWLETLLAQMLPKQHFKMQYRFKSGVTCDAVITMPDGHLVPIDSKFSLENFRKLLAAKDSGERKQYERLFVSDIKHRIDEIATRYVLPDEGTLNFAFMYVPAENVYYQAFVEDQSGANLQRYAFERHVIPVSPNSLYPYLEIVLFGLRGLQIEQSAKDIQKGLSGLVQDLSRFDEAYRKVGEKLRLAQQNFELSDKQLTRVHTKLGSLSQRELELSDSPDLPPLTSGDNE